MENMAKRFILGKEDAVVNEAIHLLNLFTFHATTPSNRVREYIEETFFSASKDGTIQLLTNKGVKSSNSVRIATSDMPFLTNTPLLYDAITIGAQEFITRIREADMLRTVSWEDVKAELSGRTMSELHAVQFLRWLVQERLPSDKRRELLSSTLVIVGDEKSGRLVNLGQITSYALPGRIPVDGGLPPYVLPLDLAKTFSTKELTSLYVPDPVLVFNLIVAGSNSAFKNG
jgi:hypothetical protein